MHTCIITYRQTYISMTAGAVSATVPSIVLVYQLSEFREQIAAVRTYLGICGLARAGPFARN